MKIFVITRHAIVNHGSILQTIATSKFFKDSGYECVIIDYVNSDEVYPKSIKSYLRMNDSWNKNIIKRFLFRIIKLISMGYAENKFKKFRNKNLKMTKRINDLQNFDKDFGTDFILCSGSDQLWGPIITGEIDNNYLLAFSNNEKKISFSSSVGRSVCFDNYQIELLKKYRIISTREPSLNEYFKTNGVNNTFSVLDPTLMISFKFWEDFSLKGKSFSNDYILVYRLHKNQKFEEFIKKISKEMNLPVFRVSNAIEDCFLYGKTKLCVTPETFLSLIRDAKLVITDSFHCTVFSIVFKKNFYTISPGKTAVRVKDFLRDLDLSDRLITDIENFIFFDKKIDYDSIHKLIEDNRRIVSKTFLEKVGEIKL